MEWICPDCKTPEIIKTNPAQVTEGDQFYLCCDKCGTLLLVTIKRSKDCMNRNKSVWGIPRKDGVKSV